MFRHQTAIDATDFVRQFQGTPCLYALCHELLCVEVDNSLFLWNPSMRIYRKLPNPLFQARDGIGIDWYDGYDFEVGIGQYNRYEFVYGLGYDSAADDYKILKIPRMNSRCRETELYSLKRNCWRKIDSFSAKPSFSQERCEFVDGTFHWLTISATYSQAIIVSFCLSTEEYGEVVQPEYFPVPNLFGDDVLEVVAVRGMLCVCVNYCRETRFVLWVMEEYGVERCWTKKFDIQYRSSRPYFPFPTSAESLFTLKPLYFYDNGDILIKVSTDKCHLEIFMYKNDIAIPKDC
ncbi:F-box/kelch-repeat protein At3g06240-like [Salvia miltiorrhiza]|uniref:F-box/kelch-repeat protein At3g06240-like n=1 Tax=Salvia miltiorrhiza TaxID=226208 RepID=UPI0025AC2F93|nr:F-box/kelch-repeat protein At3g06240-like [Salvia miltiorrhiza]XP_057765069.1 F-box/kelch-repeat protein At3g06240-like [Salvia miltiorrhiza]XP_057765070.1 F-box/kelch-repeat protein At3g06240-like [Salvia miltiorrhiza]